MAGCWILPQPASNSLEIIMEKYSLIIAVSRGCNNYDLLFSKIKQFYKLFIKPTGKHTKIVSGTAQGADRMGEQFAQHFNLELIRMPADWDTHGKAAGYKRNEAMAAIADGCIVFWDGKSNGSFHMMNIAFAKHLDLWIIKADGSIHRSPGELV